jgi:hypothetical protein
LLVVVEEVLEIVQLLVLVVLVVADPEVNKD